MLWNIDVVTAPDSRPVTLDDVKDQGRIDATADDLRLLGMIDGAIGDIDGKYGWLGRTLITQTLKLTMDRFPSRRILLPLPPLQSVSSVKYLDADEVEQTVSSSDYRVVTTATPGYVELKTGKSWPAIGTFSDAVRIEYVAGYGDAEDVPQPIKEWLVATTADRYDQRTPTVIGVSTSRLTFVDRMLDSFKVRYNSPVG